VSSRIVLVEPRRLLRDALTEALRDGYRLEVAATDGDAAATLLQIERTRASVVVVAATTQRDGLPKLCERLNGLVDPPPVLVLDGAGSDEMLLHAIESGAAGYVTGHGGLAGIVEAIHTIARGESVVPPAMLGTLLRGLIERQREAAEAAERLVTLTRRELEVLSLLVEGQDATRIAAVLVISPETARTHVQRVLRKLGVHSRLEAMTLVATTGLAERLDRMVERSVS
jgi:two-component system, NarL family, nitrate/nitrite response regulator NarL